MIGGLSGHKFKSSTAFKMDSCSHLFVDKIVLNCF